MTDTTADLGPITPVRCTHGDCPWAVHGIPERYVGSRNDYLRRHLAEDHKPKLADTDDTQPWTITSSPAMQAVEAQAEREHLASTADADRLLIGDDQGPHWKAVERAEEVLSRHDATALCTLRDLDKQCDARGREISRLRAELATAKAQVTAALTVTSLDPDDAPSSSDYHARTGYNDAIDDIRAAINNATASQES